MSQDADKAEYHRERLRRLMKEVPKSVLSGSIQQSARYKDAIKQAHKALKSTGSIAKLSEAYNRLAGFY